MVLVLKLFGWFFQQLIMTDLLLATYSLIVYAPRLLRINNGTKNNYFKHVQSFFVDDAVTI